MKYAFLFGILTLMLAQTSLAIVDINEMLSEKSDAPTTLGQQDDFICPALAESETRDQPKSESRSLEIVDEVSVKYGAKAI